jgi:hypothetical protein
MIKPFTIASIKLRTSAAHQRQPRKNSNSNKGRSSGRVVEGVGVGVGGGRGFVGGRSVGEGEVTSNLRTRRSVHFAKTDNGTDGRVERGWGGVFDDDDGDSGRNRLRVEQERAAADWRRVRRVDSRFGVQSRGEEVNTEDEKRKKVMFVPETPLGQSQQRFLATPPVSTHIPVLNQSQTNYDDDINTPSQQVIPRTAPLLLTVNPMDKYVSSSDEGDEGLLLKSPLKRTYNATGFKNGLDDDAESDWMANMSQIELDAPLSPCRYRKMRRKMEVTSGGGGGGDFDDDGKRRRRVLVLKDDDTEDDDEDDNNEITQPVKPPPAEINVEINVAQVCPPKQIVDLKGKGRASETFGNQTHAAITIPTLQGPGNESNIIMKNNVQETVDSHSPSQIVQDSVQKPHTVQNQNQLPQTPSPFKLPTQAELRTPSHQRLNRISQLLLTTPSHKDADSSSTEDDEAITPQLLSKLVKEYTSLKTKVKSLKRDRKKRDREIKMLKGQVLNLESANQFLGKKISCMANDHGNGDGDGVGEQSGLDPRNDGLATPMMKNSRMVVSPSKAVLCDSCKITMF